MLFNCGPVASFDISFARISRAKYLTDRSKHVLCEVTFENGHNFSQIRDVRNCTQLLRKRPSNQDDLNSSVTGGGGRLAKSIT